MSLNFREYLDNLRSGSSDLENDAYIGLMSLTEERVDWAYIAWDELLADLKSRNNRVRSIAAQVLSNLAKSDPDQRMLHDLDRLIEGTFDEKFVTARHTLGSLWRVGVVSKEMQELVTERLRDRFEKAGSEKNGTLVRYDIIVVLRKMYDSVPENEIMVAALDLINQEDDLKYQKKYATVWNDLTKTKKGSKS